MKLSIFKVPESGFQDFVDFENFLNASLGLPTTTLESLVRDSKYHLEYYFIYFGNSKFGTFRSTTNIS